ncbi:hypothetical protein SERLA73DRAFT_76850 [Serpula lacrymans var. lacrymans S7.3]|uniref:Uncharacterized protein n=2 Tax=Serpula lacrymans var. lacrymans TaxID=341189 RepID=F8Q8A3_SERL3|nr:uncharacterized protein SERLADRAFT_441666 [Serpula lacrymans var. lacrymans S7.9]EGN95791.1 hypothetical protein SERLA73DRAFT_76850 [Serpula lacrymans var. lacrymans S7.3]EGO21312.1 hypothetical protein SERLADRAFT_441666 [Serpula lacrymans var. lacrymans S7.9]
MPIPHRVSLNHRIHDTVPSSAVLFASSPDPLYDIQCHDDVQAPGAKSTATHDHEHPPPHAHPVQVAAAHLTTFASSNTVKFLGTPRGCCDQRFIRSGSNDIKNEVEDENKAMISTREYRARVEHGLPIIDEGPLF